MKVNIAWQFQWWRYRQCDNLILNCESICQQISPVKKYIHPIPAISNSLSVPRQFWRIRRYTNFWTYGYKISKSLIGGDFFRLTYYILFFQRKRYKWHYGLLSHTIRKIFKPNRLAVVIPLMYDRRYGRALVFHIIIKIGTTNRYLVTMQLMGIYSYTYISSEVHKSGVSTVKNYHHTFGLSHHPCYTKTDEVEQE